MEKKDVTLISKNIFFSCNTFLSPIQSPIKGHFDTIGIIENCGIIAIGMLFVNSPPPLVFRCEELN
jgi:hypothetical protein